MSDDEGRYAWIGLAGAKGYFAGAGCILLGMLACGGICAWVFGGSYLTITGSSAYADAVRIVKGNPEVLRAFGGSLEVGSVKRWHMKGSKADNWFNAEIGLAGPSGEGVMTLEASGSYDAWRIDILGVTKGSEKWDLTPPRPR